MRQDEDPLGGLAVVSSDDAATPMEALKGLAIEAARYDWCRPLSACVASRQVLETQARFARQDSEPILAVYEAELKRMAGLAAAGRLVAPNRCGEAVGVESGPIESLEGMIADGSFVNAYTRDNPAPRQEFAIKPVVQSGALNFIHAPPKSSKSNFAFYCVCAALRGSDPIPGAIVLGASPPRRVLLLDEMPEEMVHEFLDLYDPGYELRASGRLIVASSKFKRLLRSPDALRDCVSHAVEARDIDFVLVDTYTAFAAMTAGQSIGEAADASAMVNALVAIPATVWCCHHDRKAGDGSSAHVHMLGSTAIRAASSANLGIRVVDQETTVMKAEVEARDPNLLKWLARCAEARAGGEKAPEAPETATRSWWLRLGWDEERRSVVYRLAESDQIPLERGADATPRHERGDVQAAVNEALVRHTRKAADRRDPRVITPKRLTPEVQTVWSESDDRQGRASGRDVIESVLDRMGGVERVQQGEYPGDGRAGGYGLSMYLPTPLGDGLDPEVGGAK